VVAAARTGLCPPATGERDDQLGHRADGRRLHLLRDPVGGAQGRTLDERIALELGVLGQETTGPGGLAYAIRTLPVMLKIAERARALAPEAWFINFTNPAGIVTEGLRLVLGDRVVGICDTPIGLMRRAALAVTGSSTVGHLRLCRAQPPGMAALARGDGTGSAARPAGGRHAAAWHRGARLMGMGWVRALGALPNEYLYYYYYNREAVERIRASEATRGSSCSVSSRLLQPGGRAAGTRPRAVGEDKARTRVHLHGGGQAKGRRMPARSPTSRTAATSRWPSTSWPPWQPAGHRP